MLYAGLKAKDAVMPTFSLDGGVVLRPSKTRAFCGYATDGSTDDNGQHPNHCDHVDPATCLPSCGNPPDWCLASNAHEEGFWNTCGLDWGRSGIRPWRPEDFSGPGGLLDVFVQNGQPFGGIGNWKGYNEVVVDTNTWLKELPHSVEAMFIVECDDWERNTEYPPGSHGWGTAQTCGEAHERARNMHQKFLRTYDLDAVQFPLLKLRTRNWDKPFVTYRYAD